MEAEILSLLSVALVSRDNAHPVLAHDIAANLLDKFVRHIRAEMQRPPANGICRTCGRSDDTPQSLRE